MVACAAASAEPDQTKRASRPHCRDALSCPTTCPLRYQRPRTGSNGDERGCVQRWCARLETDVTDSVGPLDAQRDRGAVVAVSFTRATSDSTRSAFQAKQETARRAAIAIIVNLDWLGRPPIARPDDAAAA